MMQPEKEMPKISIPNCKNGEKTEVVTDVDAILEKIKPFGRYQFLVAFIYSLAFFQGVINNLFMGYGGIKPKWICSDPKLADNSSSIDPNIPTDNCKIYKSCSPGNITFIIDFNSIVSEWSLVCDKDYFVDLITTIQMIGLLTGALMISPVSDMFGRKWTFFLVLCVEHLLGALSALAPNATVFAFFRFAIGWCVGAENVVGWVYAAEVTTNRYRLLVRIVAAVFLPMWNQVLVAYLTKDWKWYSIIGNLEGLPVLPILVFCAYESPRWLVQKGRIDEARQILDKIAKINRTSHLMPENIDLETESRNKNQKTYQVWDLFRTRRLALFTLACTGTWFAVSLAHYGMYFDFGNLPTNVYVNGIILASIDMLIIPLAACDAYFPRMNRKHMMVSLFAIAAVANAAIALFDTVIPVGQISQVLLSLSSIIGLVTTEAIFDMAYVYSIELFPTLLRSNAGGLSSVSARIGGAIAPQLLYAAKVWRPLPYIIFGSVCIFGATIDALFLPNTRNMHLPETVAQSNQLTKEVQKEVTVCESMEDQTNGVDNTDFQMARDSVATIIYDDEGWSKRSSDASIRKY